VSGAPSTDASRPSKDAEAFGMRGVDFVAFKPAE
jgi:hypothetical protein